MKVIDNKTNYAQLLIGKTPKKQKDIDLILDITMPAIAKATESLGQSFRQHTIDTAKSREIFETNLTIQIMKAVEEGIEKSVSKNIPIYVNGHIKRLSEKVDEYQKRNEEFMQDARPMLNAFNEHNGAIAFGKKKLFNTAKVFSAVTAIIMGAGVVITFLIKLFKSLPQ